MINGITIEELDSFSDARGWSIRPFDETAMGAGHFAGCHVVSMVTGAVRGNHTHKKQTETLVPVSGTCLFSAVDPVTGKQFEQTFRGEPLYRITIAPGIPHAFKNISHDMVYLFCIADTAYDPATPDVFPHKIL